MQSTRLASVTSLLLGMILLMGLKPSDEMNRKNLRLGRVVDAQVEFDVPLNLELQFVNESLAEEFETTERSNPNSDHFCRSVQAQVRSLRVRKRNILAPPPNDGRC